MSTVRTKRIYEVSEALKTLYIIGNGFDLTHGLNTKYQDFRGYFKDNYPEDYYMFSNYYHWDDEKWGDFEENLADISQYTNEKIEELNSEVDTRYNDLKMSLKSDDTDNLGIEMYDDDLRNMSFKKRLFVPNDLKSIITKAFSNWARTIDCEIESLSSDAVLTRPHKLIDGLLMPALSSFITFNYSHTLEILYGINNNRILHVHGDCNELETIVFGHGGGKEFQSPTIEEKIEFSDPVTGDLFEGTIDAEIDSRVISIVQEWRDNYIDSMEKGIRQDDVNEFLNGKDFDQIVCIGFSFGSVDMPYIRQIYEKFPTAEWYVSYYSDGERKQINDKLTEVGVNKKELIKLT